MACSPPAVSAAALSSVLTVKTGFVFETIVPLYSATRAGLGGYCLSFALGSALGEQKKGLVIEASLSSYSYSSCSTTTDDFLNLVSF